MKTRISGLNFNPQDNSAALRTGAAHLLPDFSGCGRTRRTRSNVDPALYQVFKIIQILNCCFKSCFTLQLP